MLTMDLQSLYKRTEWITLQFAVMWIFHSVAGADGVIDKKEQQSLKQLATKSKKFKNHLIKELFESMGDNIGNIFRQSMSDPRGPKKGLAEAIKLIESTLPKEDCIDFKKHLITIGFFVANTSGEKDTSKVSVEEANIIANLALALGLKIEDMRQTPTISEIMGLLNS